MQKLLNKEKHYIVMKFTVHNEDLSWVFMYQMWKKIILKKGNKQNENTVE